MNVFDRMAECNYEQLVYCQDGQTGLKALIAIHDTTLGPALGGTRMWAYGSEKEAVIDALRLARGMTYKAAVANLPLGGGKGVIIGDPARDKSEGMLKSYGRFVETLGGRYITAEDVGTTQKDMDVISLETAYVTGRDPDRGGSGDPSPFTARGVYYGIKAAVKHYHGKESLQGFRIAVQGAGNVGYNLCRFLAREGARLWVTDINTGALQKVAGELGAVIVSPEEIYDVDCHIFAPCALGAVINDNTVDRLKCDIVAGAANNVLAEERHGYELQRRGIKYMPDYVINAGGLINVAGEYLQYGNDDVEQKLTQIYDTALEVIAVAERECVPTYRAADMLAEARIGAAGSSAPAGEVQKVG